MKAYYGIKFPELPLASEENKKQLAKEMFLHPDLGCESVKSLLYDTARLERVFLICSKLDCSIQEITQTDQESNDEFSLLEKIIRKIQHWTIEFSFPTLEEFTELSDHHEIPLELIIRGVLIAVIEARLPSKRILDFLRKYASLLSMEQIDVLLDLINERRNDEAQ